MWIFFEKIKGSSEVRKGENLMKFSVYLRDQEMWI